MSVAADSELLMILLPVMVRAEKLLIMSTIDSDVYLEYVKNLRICFGPTRCINPNMDRTVLCGFARP